MLLRAAGFAPFAHGFSEARLEYVFEALGVGVAAEPRYLFDGHVRRGETVFHLFQPQIFDRPAHGVPGQFAEAAVHEPSGNVAEMAHHVVDADVVGEMGADVFSRHLHEPRGAAFAAEARFSRIV